MTIQTQTPECFEATLNIKCFSYVSLEAMPICSKNFGEFQENVAGVVSFSEFHGTHFSQALRFI